MVAISSWGRLESPEHDLTLLSSLKQVPDVIRAGKLGLPYGMGRSYGDACLNPNGSLWKTTGLDRFVSFDEQVGRIVCEAGILLRDIQRLVIPRGWTLPVTPGTQLITLGGAIANDVHGKNHHLLGSFGHHVKQITLLRTNGEIVECGPQNRQEWFAATVGGVGLTGFILTAEIQLSPVSGPWIETETIPYENLAEFFRLADESEADWQHTVSWIDCISGGGRGIFMRGNHVDVSHKHEPSKRSITMPLTPPFSLVNRLTLRPFNMAYFNIKKWNSGRSIAHYESFFYPLDNILEWNRMYGPKGFYQYQSVVPRSVGQESVRAMLREISRFGEGSFLAVLKTFGNLQPVGMLSFPQPGVTLALDFPNNGEGSLKLFHRLDAIVREAGGRIYLAKDARMPRELFEAGYPKFSEFLQYRDSGISSAMSRRLMGN